MTAPRLWLLLCCTALCAGMTGCRKESAPETPAQAPGAPATPPAVDPAAGAALGQRLRESRAAYEEAYRLEPDARLLLAFADLEHLLTGRPRPSVTARFHEGRWVVQSEEREYGTLPPFPDFADALALLEQRARTAAPLALGLPAEPLPGSDTPLPLGRRALETLHLLDQDWAGPGRGLVTLNAATRAAASLAFQLVDLTETADLVPARALALLALSRATTSAPLVEERAALAHALGYTKHARQLARELPSGNLLAAFLLGDDEALQGALKREKTPGLASYLWVRRLSLPERPPRADQLRQSARLLAHPEPHMLMARLLVRDLDGDQFVGEVLAPLLIDEVAWATGAPEKAERPRGKPRARPPTDAELTQRAARARSRFDISPRGLLVPFEEQAGLIHHPSAFFLDEDVERAFLRGGVYSVLERLGLHLLQARAAPDAALAFSAAVGPAAQTQASRDFQGWYAQLLASRKDQHDEQALRETLDGLESFGAAPLARIFEELEDGADWRNPVLIPVTRQLAARMDSRPAHRATLARMAWTALSDIALSERHHRASLQATEDPDTASWLAWLERDFPAMRRLLHDPLLPGARKVVLVERLVGARQFTPDEAAREMEVLTALHGQEWGFVSACVERLERRKDYARARTLVERWRQWTTGTEGFERTQSLSVLARLYALQGEPTRGWQLLEPVLRSDQFDVLSQGALLSQALGNETRARELAEHAVQRYAGTKSLIVLLEVLWRGGHFTEAAQAVSATRRSLRTSDWHHGIGERFVSVFADRPLQDVVRALSELGRGGVNVLDLQGLAVAARRAGNLPLAFELQSRLRAPPGPQQLELTVHAYQYYASWKSPREALEWVRLRIPVQLHAPLSALAFGDEADALLWDILPLDERTNESFDYIWLMRMASSIRTKDATPAHLEALHARFQPERPGFYHHVGRYLRGLTPEDTLLAMAMKPEQQQELPFFLGLKAQAQGRYEEASTWYRATVEQGGSQEDEHRWAYNQLQDWKSEELSLARMRTQSP